MEALNQVQLQGGADVMTVYLTLLALYILAEAFEDDEDEWQMIASKARDFLR